MAKLPIINVPDPQLKTVSTPVEAIDATVQTLLDDMLETMYDAPGIGLSAIQVGIPKRIVVMDTEGDADNPSPRFFINPEVVWESDDFNTYNEGCLSIPEHYAEVERPESVRVRFLDRDGSMQEELFDGLNATCIQHEIDHLNGVVFIDYLSRLKRNMIIKKVRKATKDVAVL